MTKRFSTSNIFQLETSTNFTSVCRVKRKHQFASNLQLQNWDHVRTWYQAPPSPSLHSHYGHFLSLLNSISHSPKAGTPDCSAQPYRTSITQSTAASQNTIQNLYFKKPRVELGQGIVFQHFPMLKHKQTTSQNVENQNNNLSWLWK